MTTMPFEKLRLGRAGFKNPRTSSGLTEASICELAIHIGLHGLLNLPLVLDDGLIIAGQRRYRAIEFLLSWFSLQPRHVRDQAAEHGRFHELFGDLTHADISIIERTTRSFEDDGVPVRVLSVGPGRAEGLALADNVQREDLTTFEEAKYIDFLVSQGSTQADVARLVGKSKTWVSRRLAAFLGSHDDVLKAWEMGVISFDAAYELSKLPAAEQARQLSGPTPRGIRGPANRPGIDTVKEILGELDKRGLSETPRNEIGKARYATGVRDALRWIVGEQTSRDFAELMEVPSDAG